MLGKSTLSNILFLIFPTILLAQECNQKGHCQNGQLSGFVTAKDGLDCLKQCQNSDSCKWFTFNSKYDEYNCEMFRTCENIDPTCYNQNSCCSGQSSCPSERCELKGICLVSNNYFVNKQRTTICL